MVASDLALGAEVIESPNRVCMVGEDGLGGTISSGMVILCDRTAK